ncbi:MAG: hypothetical protein K1X53_08380 [Candidatus Sumerlaeaceae bacterium]|nr:hypothetical protein [Candidatus Sumerlaeaceae bacterium]
MIKAVFQNVALASAALTLGLATVPTAVHAKDRHVVVPQSRTSRGYGKFQVGNDKPSTIVAATATLAGRAMSVVLTLRDGTTLELKGVAEGNGRTFNYETRSGFGKESLSGSGQVVLTDDRTRLASISGRGIVGNSAYSFEFAGGNGAPEFRESAAPEFSFSDDVFGAGRYDLGDRKMRVTGMQITMSRSHGFSIHLHGPELSGIVWEGTWSGNGPVYNIDLRHAGQESMSVRGQITLSGNRREFRSLEGEGKVYGENVRIYFGKEE